MWTFNAPAAVCGLLALTFLPAASAKPYPVHVEELRELHNATQIVKRDCASGSTACGWYGTLCCSSDQTCITDANNQAQCSSGATAGAATSGWQYYTTTWVETGVETKTSVYSSYVAGAQATATCSDSQSPCGSVCCDSGYYCLTSGSCKLIAGGSSGGILPTASAPVRPTSSGVVVVTYTGTPTTTVAFQTPVPTGASSTLVPVAAAVGGLSGGAIAGIVIGVLLGLLLLSLLCLYCCARALFDTLLGILGLGKKSRKHTHEETYIEEHHSSGGGAAGGRWYGQGGPSRPSRTSEKQSGVGKAGIAAAIGAGLLALGLKKKNDRKHDDKSTTVSGGSSYYYSDYTSSSSASSDDRRTRTTRQSSRR